MTDLHTSKDITAASQMMDQIGGKKGGEKAMKPSKKVTRKKKRTKNF